MIEETIEYKGHTFRVFRCFPRDNNKTWIFFCPHCKTWHTHGAGEGHRSAHCHDAKSPYYSTGYYLKQRVEYDLDQFTPDTNIPDALTGE